MSSLFNETKERLIGNGWVFSWRIFAVVAFVVNGWWAKESRDNSADIKIDVAILREKSTHDREQLEQLKMRVDANNALDITEHAELRRDLTRFKDRFIKSPYSDDRTQ